MNKTQQQGRGAGREERNVRREDAEKRNARWQALTPEQQLAELDKAFGKNQGAAKQRAKIAKRLKVERVVEVAREEKQTKEKKESTKNRKQKK